MGRTLLGVAELLGLGVWIGAITLFSAVTAPTAFRALDAEHAGIYIRSAFPAYYTFCMIVGGLALIAGAAYRVAARDLSGLSVLTAALVGIMLGTTVYARIGLMPRVEASRVARNQAVEGSAEYADAQAAFRVGHTLSVVLNALVWLLGVAVFVLVLLARYAWRV